MILAFISILFMFTMTGVIIGFCVGVRKGSIWAVDVGIVLGAMIGFFIGVPVAELCLVP